jgi:hypothetical protein
VTYNALEGSWWLWLPCPSCGGAAMPLRERPGCRPPDERWCPSCETRQRRTERPGADPTVWYDTGLADWVVRLPCGRPGNGALLPLELRFFDTAWAEVIRVAADVAYGPA